MNAWKNKKNMYGRCRMEGLMTHREKYRRMVYFLLIVSIAGLFFGCWLALKNRIPDHLYVTSSGEVPELFEYPFSAVVSEQIVDRKKKDGTEVPENMQVSGGSGCEKWSETSEEEHQDAVEVSAGRGILEDIGETYQIKYALFGRIPLKTASVNVVSRKSVYAAGTPIGIYMETKGVMVVDTASVTGTDGEQHEPSANILKSGDYIQAADGIKLNNKEELIACFQQSRGKDVVLDVARNGETIRLKVTPVQTGVHDYKAGIWVRSDTQGIGTLTYVEDSGTYGALGHGISDVDTGKLLQIKDGKLYDAEVISIIKGQQGTPGELAGLIHYNEGYVIGNIEKNQENGIYGTISGFPEYAKTLRKYETAYKQEVETGDAVLLSFVDGTLQEYQIEIEELRMNENDVNKGMVLKVTDPELLNLTGGIVQGMSGSPIIQDGKLVGAVTHVYVNE